MATLPMLVDTSYPPSSEVMRANHTPTGATQAGTTTDPRLNQLPSNNLRRLE